MAITTFSAEHFPFICRVGHKTRGSQSPSLYKSLAYCDRHTSLSGIGPTKGVSPPPIAFCLPIPNPTACLRSQHREDEMKFLTPAKASTQRRIPIY
ncbi:hypothetical protein OE88DRAFT_413620 [Heliocybe sulcata]|uniref:Uncharacterized protein n=1 Tax=Heliocybe sulcata TaxID=5364 RepID=A0A5C3MWL4_9AGAM|nr:hypothetical protein OE88DRAFT_413620 [Heliocybe sulcata]